MPKKKFFTYFKNLGFNRLEILKIRARLAEKGIIKSADYDKYFFNGKPDFDKIIDEDVFDLFVKR